VTATSDRTGTAPVALELVDWDHADAVRLRTDQQRELRDRYGDDDIGHAMTGDGIVAFVLARAGGQAVACGALRDVTDELGPGTGELKRMYVEPDQRGRGYARAVLTELERIAAERGFTRLVLETGVLQPEAIGLYLRAGWAPIPNYGEYVGVADSRCFAKSLGPGARRAQGRPADGIVIDRATWDDADAVALRAAMDAFRLATYPEVFAPDRHDFAADDAQLGAHALAVLVARLDGHAVGHLALTEPGDGYPPASAELKRMFVDPAVRGTGAARALLAAAEDEARLRGFAQVVLQTGNRQPEAVGLYVSAGYRAVVPFGPYVDDRSLLFAKEL
jgi:GNAT superfamily N-acetyltransferase